jgi:iron complex outermembrane recepter protein
MKSLKYNLVLLALLFNNILLGQTQVSGKIFDNLTQEPLVGAIVKASSTIGVSTDELGRFSIKTESKTLQISALGYKTQEVTIPSNGILNLGLEASPIDLQQVVVTANREAQLRSEAPIAISKLSSKLIDDTKAISLFEVMNKVSGVNMVNLNNEQHMMSIRQPITTIAYFLYLEDGLPIRPLGVFSNNALLEMNLLSVSSIEVVKGPASSIYGAEAVGGTVNIITHRPTAVPTAKVGVQFDQWGYQRVQFGTGATVKNFGFYLGGYVAKQRDSWQTRTDFDKVSLNARLEYRLGDKTRASLMGSYQNYDSQTSGNVDSIGFYQRKYVAVADFTYRKTKANRLSLRIDQQWNPSSESFLTFFYRNNSLAQNPSYAIRWTTGATTARGEINDNTFQSYGVLAQHIQRFNFLKSKWLTGATFDYSPNQYYSYVVDLAAQLRADKRSVEKYTVVAERPDVFNVNYDAKIRNMGVYSQFDFEPIQKLRFSVGSRYDRMSFDFDNFLDNSTGTRVYEQFSPKIGATYQVSQHVGLYANYALGFSPPGLTAIFRKRPTPAANGDMFYYNLEPARFQNYEVGGWASLFKNKIYLDWALYEMNGKDELLNIRQTDNSFDYQSVGKTLHRGLEYSLNYRISEQWNLRMGGTNALHRFVEFTLSTRASDAVKNVNGNDMPQSPSWIFNTEISYNPKFLKGYRVSLEWQRISGWFQNQINTVRYADRTLFGLDGTSVLNLRTGYNWRGVELFVNILNLTDELYAHNVSRGNSPTDRSNFTPAAPRTFTMGIQYNFVGKR